MSDHKNKPSGLDWLDPFVATNLLIRITWQLTAGIIALAIRLVTSIVLAIVRRVQRSRIVRW